MYIYTRSAGAYDTMIKPTAYSYRHLKSSLNFDACQGAAAFEIRFPDKKYTLIAADDLSGDIAFATAVCLYRFFWVDC